MDKDTRSLLQRATQAARRTLEEEYAAQLEGVFDIRPDGTVAPEAGRHLADDGEAQRVRVKLVAAVQHHREQGRRPADAVAAVLRECAFTTLNRFVALKMLEAREIVKPCVSLGPLSGGFKEFTGLAPGLATLPDQGYRLYLDSLFDEIGREVKVLFDRRDPASLLWPRKTALDALLVQLNDAALAGVWGEDETIGWVYQYFNSQEDRDTARYDALGKPKPPGNSRELAVRNQFFTPRYVVEFLTDNTLGRTWVEMRRGDTRLVESCRYLVKRPSEVFLAEGEAEPEGDATTPPEARPSYVPYRAKKDPRDLRVLDPACGSGHFLLYSFDLLAVTYEESWADPAGPASEATGRSLVADYPTLDALRRALPGLVLRHNLYGVDIDPRAAQIAALALWMRAQRAWNEFGFKRAERPLVTRTNIVVAEPMPGEPDLLDGLCAGLDKPVADVVRAVFDNMKLAGEAGMLLRIEDAVRRGVEQLARVGGLFASEDAWRWDRLEARVYSALRSYAESAGGAGYRRRLFAEDAAQGFAFIDVCRRSYDVVLMNPPFGDAVSSAASAIGSRLSSAGNDVGALFVSEASTRWCPGGTVGVLLSTGPWFKPAFEGWRKTNFYGSPASLLVAGHLAGEVLDGATVTASPFVLDTRSRADAVVIRLTRSIQLDSDIRSVVSCLSRGETDDRVFRLPPSEAAFLPGGPFCYWASSSLRKTIGGMPKFEGHGGSVRTGLQTSDEERFCRAWWEISPDDANWLPYSKSSPFSPFWDDYTWCERVGDGLREVRAFSRAKPQNTSWFGRAGVTYPSKSVLGFNVRLHPSGSGFAHSACVAFSDDVEPLALLGFLGSRPVEYLISFFVGDLQGKAGVHPNQYEVGILQRLPWPGLDPDRQRTLADLAARAVNALRRYNQFDETTRTFGAPFRGLPASWSTSFDAVKMSERRTVELVSSVRAQIDELVLSAYGFEPSDEVALAEAFDARVAPASGRWRIYFGESGSDLTPAEHAAQVVSWLHGCVSGRWRYELVYSESGLMMPDPLLLPPSRSPAMLDTRSPRLLEPQGMPSVIFGGIVVEDPGHEADICRLVETAVASIFGHRGDSMARDLVSMLPVGSLRDYYRRGDGFFFSHIQRYTKSRRKAPIYWRLGTPSGSYSVWLYLLRVGPDTLHEVLRDYVEPKVRYEEDRWYRLSGEAGSTPSTAQRKELSSQEAFVDELRAFRDELVRVAPLWNPDLDDGVVINASFLHRLFLHTKSWAKECEGHWEKLKAGEYDWAHLAMRLWPERVVPKCAEDRSLAIAHGVEDAFWLEGDDGKWSAREVDDATIQRLVAERTSAAVKAALRDVSAAPPPARVTRAARPAPVAKAPREKAPTQSAKQLPLDLGGARPRANSSALDALRAALHGFPDGAGKSELLAASGLDEASWMPAITELVESGEVERTGQKRGTRYQLAGRS